MKELNYEQMNPKLGPIKGILRINGKILFFKSKGDNQYMGQILSNLQARGAYIEKSLSGWVKVDMFKNQTETLMKINNIEFDLKNTSDNEIENILYDFYKLQYTKAGFKVT